MKRIEQKQKNKWGIKTALTLQELDNIYGIRDAGEVGT